MNCRVPNILLMSTIAASCAAAPDQTIEANITRYNIANETANRMPLPFDSFPGKGSSGPRVKPGLKGLRFDESPNFKEVIPNTITVIFRDEYKVRKLSNGGLLYSDFSPKAADAINKVLSRAKNKSDFSFGRRHSELDFDEKLAEDQWGVDIPNWASMFIIAFDNSLECEKALRELQNSPFVLSVYRTPSISGSNIQVWRWSNDSLGSDLYPFIASNVDQYFNSSEKDWWYWFNRHRIFESWEEYQPLGISPRVAVIDSGFDTGPSRLDATAYHMLQAAYFKWDSDSEMVYNLGADVSESPDNQFSHGTAVSTVIGGKFGNGAGVCGVTPDATILPIKVHSNTGFTGVRSDVVAAAIRYSHDSNYARVTNISMGISGSNIVADGTVRAAIAYAVSKGQIVVVSAGNEYADISASTYDVGAIIVGGTQSDGHNWKNVKPDGTISGSNFGLGVSITASARDILVANFDPMYGFRQFSRKSGTSFSAPMVSAAAAVVHELYLRSGLPVTNNLAMVYRINRMITYSGTLGKSSGGEDLGVPGTGSPDMRELNVTNAYRVAKLGYANPVVRLTNIDDSSVQTFDSNWGLPFLVESKGVDVMYSIGYGMGYASTLDFATYNASGPRTHGYQVWRNGEIWYESLGGTAEKRAPWGKLYDTFGEDSGSTATGWFNTLSFPYYE